MKTINLNDRVKVKLNSFGRMIIVESFKYAGLPEPTTAYLADSNGYVTFALWELFQMFGPFIGLGWELPFAETDIILESMED